MNDTFISDLIEDLDHMRQLLERCIKKLQSQVKINPNFKNNTESDLQNNSVKSQIEQHKKSIMEQVTQIREKAIQSINKIGTNVTPNAISSRITNDIAQNGINIDALRKKLNISNGEQNKIKEQGKVLNEVVEKTPEKVPDKGKKNE